MAKKKYLYNDKSCTYEEVRIGRKQFFINLAGFIALSVILASGMIYFYQNYTTPIKEQNLIDQNQNLLSEYKILKQRLSLTQERLADLQLRDDKIYRTILDIEPIPATVRSAGIGGSDRWEGLEISNPNREEMIISTYEDLDKIKGRMYIQTKSYDELESVLDKKRRMWDSRPAITPLMSEDIKRIGSGFRWRFHPLLNIRRFHKGIDISADSGKPIYASANGKIVRSNFSRSYGNVVYIDHGFGYETRYAHLSKFNVEDGQYVKRGDIIGYIGSTGLSSAPHLHYEILFRGSHIDPVPYLSKNLSSEEFEKLIDDSNNSDLILDY